MKKFLISLFLAVLAVACSVDEPSYMLPVDIQRPVNTSYVYEAFSNKDVWKQFSSFEERMEACQVPADIASQLTTDALIQTCLNHPFAPMYTAYENEFEIVQKLVDHNNAFKELLRRCDASEKLVNYYAGNPALSMGQMHFLELLLGSGLFPEVYEEPLESILKVYAENQLSIRRLMPEKYSIHSRKTASLLVEELKENDRPTLEEASNRLKRIESTGESHQTKSAGDYQYSIQLYTAYGQSLTGTVREEFTNDEIAEHDSTYTNLFPNAILLEHSSATYECHSYAWNMSMGGPTCWINSPNPYISDATYLSTNTINFAKAVYFPNQDFSAIPVNSSTIISKWELGPLMRHSINDSPYALTSGTGYIYGARYFSINGQDFVNAHTANPYTYSYSYSFTASPGSSFEWSVVGPNELSSDYTMTVSGNQMNIVFNDTGEYNIWCHYYYNGIAFGSASFYVLAVASGRIESVDDEE